MPGGPWLSWTRTLSCKSDASLVHDPQEPKKKSSKHHQNSSSHRRNRSKIQPIVQNPLFKANPSPSSTSSSAFKSCNCSNLRDVIHGNTRVVHRASSSGSPRDDVEESDYISQEALFFEDEEPSEIPLRGSAAPPSSSSSSSISLRKKFSTCNGCNVAVESLVSCKESLRNSCNYPSLACIKCGDCFSRIDALENHQTMHHAVSELPRGDSSRNIVEIIFRSSWMSSAGLPCGKIERVLKVHNTQRTLSRFEDYRDAIKCKSSSSNSSKRNNARCIADGNELLRFFGSSLCCSLGAHGSSSICSLPQCNMCRIIRSGFSVRKEFGKGICTTATSSSAHAQAHQEDITSNHLYRRGAMIVCRVIAGRTFKASSAGNILGTSSEHDTGTYYSPPNGFDSVEMNNSSTSEAADLLVYNHKAVLPCFVVIYKF